VEGGEVRRKGLGTRVGEGDKGVGGWVGNSRETNKKGYV
jgi:hypothetical protein